MAQCPREFESESTKLRILLAEAKLDLESLKVVVWKKRSAHRADVTL